MNTDPVVVLITYRARPGHEEQARKELTSLISTVVEQEQNCAGISMLQDKGDPARILLHELWTDREAYLGPHMQTPHIQAFIQRAGEFMAGPPEISFWERVASF